MGRRRCGAAGVCRLAGPAGGRRPGAARDRRGFRHRPRLGRARPRAGRGAHAPGCGRRPARGAGGGASRARRGAQGLSRAGESDGLGRHRLPRGRRGAGVRRRRARRPLRDRGARRPRRARQGRTGRAPARPDPQPSICGGPSRAASPPSRSPGCWNSASRAPDSG